MIRKIWIFVREHGRILMLVGMAFVITAVAILFQSRQMSGAPSPLVWPAAIVGIVIYVLGRVGVALDARARQRESKEQASDTESQ